MGVCTPELGPSTSGTGSFQNLTGLSEGTNAIRKHKKRVVSVNGPSLRTVLQQKELYQALLLL